MSEAVALSDNSTNAPPTASSSAMRVLVAASGTGGHLIPALHIIRGLRTLCPDAVIECIGAGKPLEEKIIVGGGLTRHIIASSGVKRRGVLGIVQFLLTLPVSAVQCVRLFRSFKPDVLVGVGGYVTVVPIIVARMMRIHTWIHEAELHPGLATRVLSHFADRVSISFSETQVKGRAKPVFTGHPVRQELRTVERDTIRPDSPKRLLVLGGSQGARGLDQAVPGLTKVLRERGIEVVHQCRPENMELVLNSYRAGEVTASVVSFIDDIPGAYDWCDVVIARAGASTVAEIAVVNRPAIFVPYPFQQGTHQSDNARLLATNGKAIVVEEAGTDFIPRLQAALEQVLDPARYRAIKNTPHEAKGLEAANSIATGILTLTRPS